MCVCERERERARERQRNGVSKTVGKQVIGGEKERRVVTRARERGRNGERARVNAAGKSDRDGGKEQASERLNKTARLQVSIGCYI